MSWHEVAPVVGLLGWCLFIGAVYRFSQFLGLVFLRALRSQRLAVVMESVGADFGGSNRHADADAYAVFNGEPDAATYAVEQWKRRAGADSDRERAGDVGSHGGGRIGW